MLRYLIKRSLYAVGVLIAVSLLMFFMSALAPGDIVESHLALDSGFGAYQHRTHTQQTTAYRQAAERLDLHLPLFYFSVTPTILPDTLHRILRRDERTTFRTLALRQGSWKATDAYRASILNTIHHLETQPKTNTQWSTSAAGDAGFLLTTTDTGRIQYILNALANTIPDSMTASRNSISILQRSYAALALQQSGMSDVLPALHWHGTANRYHRWVGKVIKGDFGRSLIDGRPVKRKVGEALRWTLSINLIAILLAFGIAVPLGVVTARRAGSGTDKVASTILFAFYAMPAFWLAMLCIVFLTTSEYGKWLDWFPTGGVGMITPSMSWWETLGVRISHLTLPVFCLLVGSLAYLTRQMRGSMLRELRQDYVRLARAKGLTETQVVWRHAFRNALFPMITLVGSAFPAAISGSVILEVIFSIPGMGRLLYMSILSKDWPVVFAMVLLAATLTVIGYFVADILYRRADPRVVLQKERT